MESCPLKYALDALDVSADTLLIDVVTHSVTGVTNELLKLPTLKMGSVP